MNYKYNTPEMLLNVSIIAYVFIPNLSQLYFALVQTKYNLRLHLYKKINPFVHACGM